jgi:hypothetical protein
MIHPSSIPSTITIPVPVPSQFPFEPSSSSEVVVMIAPDAVGQSAIVEAFSKPFELDGLFVGAADAGAFRNGEGGEMERRAWTKSIMTLLLNFPL